MTGTLVAVVVVRRGEEAVRSPRAPGRGALWAPLAARLAPLRAPPRRAPSALASSLP